MNWLYYMLLTWVQLFSPFLILLSEACWGNFSPNYGDATRDYDLLVGSELKINCSLASEYLPGISGKVNSSNLVFTKSSPKPHHQDFQKFTHVIDSHTAQLIIPTAQESDSGVYHCSLSVPEKLKNPLVCSSQVVVGYAPQNVSNFKCVSRNFDNLTCTWDIEPNKVKTNYSIHKNLFYVGPSQNCPTPNNTFCVWHHDTDPPFTISTRNLIFTVSGNNSLGVSRNEFNLDLFEIVIPNSPENVTATKVEKNFVIIEWRPPRMSPDIREKPHLFYQLWLEELGSELHNRTVINVGVETFSYIVEGLLPYYLYNISLRCRSELTSNDEMWSPIISLQIETLADVPSVLPEVNPLAYELYNFKDYRNATLYWKPVAERHFNGRDFHYHVVYYPSSVTDNKYALYAKSKLPAIALGHLHNDSAYIVKIYSANEEGLSTDYKKIYIAERNKIVPSPYDIRAISNELGYYNLTWSVPGSIRDYTFTVFWCSKKHSNSHCDGPIQWSNTNLNETSFILNVTDVHINFQFGVVAVVGNESSGLQWASCIVPQKAPLGKIPIKHIEQRDSSTLTVMWSLDCDAMKSVIDRYEITYCKLGVNANCKVAKSDPDRESFILRDLQPFSNYSIKLRAFNKQNIPSEDMTESYQNTLAGAPSDAPQNIQVFHKSGTGIKIRWQPPSEPNGLISHYYLYYNGLEQYVSANSLESLSYDIDGLSYYTKYNFSMVACVSNHCSPKSKPLVAVTDVGEPGKMDPPRIEMINSTSFKVSWTAPLTPNGPIDFYVVKWHMAEDNETNFEISHGLSAVIETDCSVAIDGGRKYLFYVQAVNTKNEKILKSSFSDPTQATACIMSQGLALVIGLAVGGTLTLAICMLIFYKLVKWMHDKIHQMKNIAVKLPKELEGPELNPLSNYESFKNGLVQKNPSSKSDRLSYVFEESENKNRHGSGSSQFSNSSADELVFKNGRCTKFGRKPSGDSSGCSSMSSTTATRVQLSSDSGAESDIPIPASPDSLLMEHSIHNLQKPPLPILMEQESLDVNSELHRKPLSFTQSSKYNFTSLREDHPYSKFGISGVSSTVPWRSNSFAFYSCNLANSEPSVFETQKIESGSTVAPYSKVGLAKSSGDILGNTFSSKGYSKFGFTSPKSYYTVDIGNLNPTVGVAIVDQSYGKKVLKEEQLNKNAAKDAYLLGSYLKTIEKGSHMLASDMEPLKQHNFSSGYVSIGDMRSINDSNSANQGSVALADMDDFIDASFQMPLETDETHLSWIIKDLQIDEKSSPLTDSPDGHLIDLHDSSPLNSFSNTTNLSVSSLSAVSDRKTDEIDSRNGFRNSPSDHENSYEFQDYITPEYVNSSGRSEILLAPVINGNGYVPFSNFSSSERTQMCVPNSIESNASLSIFPSDRCAEFHQNYITPSNKSDLKILQETLVPKTNLSPKVVPFRNKDAFSGGKIYTLNGSNISKISGPLKYLLKPLPKMESEICEV